MWQNGDILMEMVCVVLVMIPKGNIDTLDIGLLESLWKVVEAIIDNLLRESVRLHDILNGFRTTRVVKMFILELNMAQDLASVDQDPPFLVFLNLQNAYDAVD